MAIKYGRAIEARIAPVERKPTTRLELASRPRRNRKAEWARRLVRENTFDTSDLIWPLFLVDGSNKRLPVPSMPGVERLSIDEAVRDAERGAKLTIPCMALFPYTDPALREEEGREGLNPTTQCAGLYGPSRRSARIGILCDVALDPYTRHGHDGLLRDGMIINY
jgi:porphobilinogen synthase